MPIYLRLPKFSDELAFFCSDFAKYLVENCGNGLAFVGARLSCLMVY